MSQLSNIDVRELLQKMEDRLEAKFDSFASKITTQVGAAKDDAREAKIRANYFASVLSLVLVAVGWYYGAQIDKIGNTAESMSVVVERLNTYPPATELQKVMTSLDEQMKTANRRLDNFSEKIADNTEVSKDNQAGINQLSMAIDARQDLVSDLYISLKELHTILVENQGLIKGE